MNNSPLKECKKCRNIKPLQDFYDQPNCVDGKGSYCKKCQSEISNKGTTERRRIKKLYAQTYFVHQNIATI